MELLISTNGYVQILRNTGPESSNSILDLYSKQLQEFVDFLLMALKSHRTKLQRLSHDWRFRCLYAFPGCTCSKDQIKSNHEIKISQKFIRLSVQQKTWIPQLLELNQSIIVNYWKQFQRIMTWNFFPCLKWFLFGTQNLNTKCSIHCFHDYWNRPRRCVLRLSYSFFLIVYLSTIT